MAGTFGASAVAFAVFVLVVEFALRATHLFGAHVSWTEPDSILGWRPTPNRMYWNHKENDHPITGRINSLGWRDKERSLEKTAGTYRIAIIGDSMVEAMQVELDSTLVALTEERLNRTLAFPVEVLNFGRSGFTQTEEWIVLQREVIAYSPDMVVLFFMPRNDIDDVNPETADVSWRPFFRLSTGGELILDTGFAQRRSFRLKRIINPLKQRSALITLLTERYNLLQRARRHAVAEAPHGRPSAIDGYMSLCTATPDSVFVENYRMNKLLIGKMAEFCRRENVRFLLVCINLYYRDEDVERYTKIDPTFDNDYFDRDMKDWADSRGIAYLGLQGPLRSHYEKVGVSLTWGHWNYEGHRAVAGALSGSLTEFLWNN